MIVTPGTAFGLPWYDRGLTSIIAEWGSTEAPHGLTQRLTYTVPAGYNFKVHTIWYYAQRMTVAAPVGRIDFMIFFDPAATAQKSLLSIESYDNVLNAVLIDKMFHDLWFAAGDTIIVYSGDGSTGGTILYRMGYFGSLYTT